MRLPSWYFGNPRKSPPRRDQRQRIPDLQSLEERLTPAVRVWTGVGADDLWSNAANWDTGVPGDGDDVRIPATAESAEVVFDSSVAGTGVTINSLTSDGTNPVGEPFRVAGDTLTLDGPGLFVFDSLTLITGFIAGTGDVRVTGDFLWTGGTLTGSGTTTLAGPSVFNLGFQSNVVLDGRTLVNNGAATLTGPEGANVLLANGALLDNRGSFTAADSADVRDGGGGGTFRNAGTFAKTGPGTGTSFVVRFDNTGTVAITDGVLELVKGGVTTGGAFAVGAGTALFFSGDYTTDAASTVSGAGAVRFQGGVVSINGAYAITGPTSINGSTANFNTTTTFPTLNLSGTLGGNGDVQVGTALNWALGEIRGSGTFTVADTATTTIAIGPFSNVVLNGRHLVNDGSATLTGPEGANVLLANGAVFDNRGSFTAADSADVRDGGGGGTFRNAGTFAKTGPGTGTSIVVPFDNTGTVAITDGVLELASDFANFSSATSTLTGGFYNIASTFLFGGANIVTNAATIILDGPASRILDRSGGNALANFASNAAGGSLTLRGGRTLTTPGAFGNAGAVTIAGGSSLTLGGTYTQTAGTTTLNGTLVATAANVQGGLFEGSGTVNGPLTNAAQVRVGGSPGSLSINGNYTQTAAGSLDVEIGGVSPGAGFDQLLVTGLTTLDGAVNVTRLGGFVPAGPDTFRIVDAGSRAGAFATVTGSNFPGGRFVLLHDATGAVLDANLAPTPSDDSDTTVEGHAVTTAVLANDSDPDGDPVTVVAVGLSAQGVTPVLNGDGTITYNPPAGFQGTDTFTYTVRDVFGTEATASVTIAVTPVNHAPTLNSISDPAAILEDAGVQSVNLIGITAGAGDVQSLTVTAKSSNPSLIPDPTVTYASPDATGSLHYTPVPNGNGTALITVTVKDDGGTAFGGVDEVTRTFTVTVEPVPDAPTIDTALIPMLPVVPLKPAPTNPAGAPVADLLHGVTEIDGDPLGLAITGIDNRKGTWQFSVNGGASWTPVPANVSATAALVLSDDNNTRVRFLPKPAFQGFSSFSFRAWDQSDGAVEGTQIDSTLTPNVYSTKTEQAWVAVGTTVPVVNADGATVLAPVREDSKSSRVFAVKSLLGIAGLERAPTTNLGIAITNLDTVSGRWQFRLANTTSFVDVGAVGEASALVLRPIDSLRFVPNANADGQTGLTFKTWNQVGRAGTKIDSQGAGFGQDPGFAVLDIKAVNDAPVMNLSAPAALHPVNPGETTNEPTFASLMAATDVDGPATGVAVVAARGSGWEFNTGGVWSPLGAVSSLRALLLNSDAQVRFVAAAGADAATATLSFKAWDQAPASGLPGDRVLIHGTAFSKQTEIATVAIGNAAPVLNTAPDVTLPDVVSTSTSPIAGTLVKTLLGTAVTDSPGSLRGIAVVFADNSNGKWQYSLNGAAYLDVGPVVPGSALLLTDAYKLRFVPNSGFTGQATIQFKAWDRTTGRAGDRIDTGPPLNSFSLEVETATVTVV